MDWRGYDNSRSPIGDNLEEANNISFRVRGELRRRPGLGLRKPLDAQSMGALATSTGSWIVGNDAGTLTGLDMDDDSTFTVASGLSATPRGNWTNAGGALYFTNGTDPIQVITAGDAVAADAGIAAPVAAPTAGSPAAGTVDAGVHLIRYRYKNSVTGYYSNPSPDLEFTAAGSQNVPLTLVASADPKVDQQVIEMTLQAGDVYYVVATQAQSTSYTINISDLLLAVNLAVNTYAAPDGFGHEPPPDANLMIEHRGRIFLWGTAANELYWSRALYPEAFNLFDWVRKVDFGRSDTPTAMAGFYSDIYLFGRRSMRRLSYETDPAAAMLITLPTDHGAYNQRCVVEANGDLYGLGPAGIWKIEGIHPEHISRPMDETFRDLADETKSEQFHGVFDPDERAIWFFFVRTGDTDCQDALCYELLTKNWSLRSFRHTIQSSLVAGDDLRPTRAWLADNDGGYIWRLQPDQFDALPPPLTSGVVTTGVGSTDTVLAVNENMPTTGQDLTGAIIYNPITGEERLIASNTSNTITLTVALATAPAPSVEFFIGSIRVEGLSEYTTVGQLNQTITPPRLQVDDLTPTGQGIVLTFTVYQDFSTTRTAFTTQSAFDTPPAGITILSNGDCQVDTSVIGPTVPAPTADAKALQWRFVQERPQNQMRIMSILWQMDQPPTKERAE